MTAKTPPANAITLHGTAVLVRSTAHAPAAVFLRGLSGTGKSDLAFRLIEAGGCTLISDDQVAFEKRHGVLHALPVDTIRGLLEVRGVGLLRYPVADAPVPVQLVVDLARLDDVPRLPEWETVEILGSKVPRIRLYAFEASAARKVMKALEAAHEPGIIIT